MKKIILGLIFINSFSYAQNGLERVVVEQYYISNAADAAQADAESSANSFPSGALPAGSITYRIYADMLPGYKLLSVYADASLGHKLKYTTTTSFYNNPAGSTTPSSTKVAIKNNLLALDSYFSLGGVATGQYGILKPQDDGLLNNVTSPNANSVLLNDAPLIMGIPLTTDDGMMTGTGIQAPSFAGFAGEDSVFADGSTPGKSLVLVDGSVYTPNGAIGVSVDSNQVLIGQITTNGKLCFELNILIKKTGAVGGEFYVANNPQTPGNPNDIEVSIPSLTQCFTPTSVGINNLPSSTGSVDLFNVYPNPAKDMVKLEIYSSKNSVSSYSIYSILGTEILHKTLAAQTHIENIDISSLENGLYYIKMSVDGVVSTKKVIKN